MPVIANTSPVLNLAVIGRLELLRDQFGSVDIPSGVVEELRLEEELPGNAAIRTAMAEGWILQRPVRNTALAKNLAMELDRGEAEAIALAVETGAETVLIDEREGRTKAKAMDLRVTGVLGVLVRARREGAISDIREVIRQLRENAGFYLSDAVVKQILIATNTF